ncbi:hypothetical protein AKJ44_02490 [candidate division MSBL1 archaeon SCGC-AAA261F17]|uniref:Uncharacterized protein n=1 Tax=candidate division MSBL1 archaeon SCGC-AAA261F17 TaxID=1698274 RepID=A0A133V4T7_9EURY|nr:hypothetical protein AKJ44_02490 [candidate division MSBL1 archaeon SCGC-AAA261F17]
MEEYSGKLIALDDRMTATIERAKESYEKEDWIGFLEVLREYKSLLVEAQNIMPELFKGASELADRQRENSTYLFSRGW